MKKGEDLLFKGQTEPFVGDFRRRTAYTSRRKIGGEANGALFRFPSRQTADERRGEYVARAAEKAFHVLVCIRAHVARFVCIGNGDPFSVRDPRYDGAGTKRFQSFYRLFRGSVRQGIGDIRQIASLGDVGQDKIRLMAKLFHFFHVLFRKAGVQLAAIPHDGVDDEYAVWGKELVFDIFHHFDLRNTAQVTAANEIEFYAEGSPMPQNIGDILRTVAEGIARKTARVRGQDRRGQDVAFDPARGKNGQGRR